MVIDLDDTDENTQVHYIRPPTATRSQETGLQNLVWGPAGTTSIAFVFENNVYFKQNLATEAVQITTDGRSDVIYNGIPDWVYEGIC